MTQCEFCGHGIGQVEFPCQVIIYVDGIYPRACNCQFIGHGKLKMAWRKEPDGTYISA